jgi:predicted metal-dependent hydrolase
VSTHKSPKIAQLIAHIQDDRYDPHYLGYFECFNRQLHYEAHDVLEELWLETKGPLHNYYKGLIQLAGAFVHLKNGKLDPAASLFRLCRKYLEPYSPSTEGLDVRELIERIDGWITVLDSSGCTTSAYDPAHPPILKPLR